MHPAPSIILFTVASGAGYGALFLYAVAVLAGILPSDGAFAVTVLFVALSLQAIGLMSSTFHLKHPERAWRALSQWRSSWLSREGVAAVLTFVPGGLWFLAAAFGVPLGPWALLLAALSLIGAAVVVSCTAMIYGSLKTIRQWHHPLVLPVYHLLALATGAALLGALAALLGLGAPALWGVAIAALVASWSVKLRYWQSIDAGSSESTPSTATGLEGRVRLSDPPHTEENYLLKEMAYTVARKHTQKLRRYAVLLGGVIPSLALAAAFVTDGTIQLVLLVIAAGLAVLGTVIERWLFFAEARHTVTLYYGAEAA